MSEEQDTKYSTGKILSYTGKYEPKYGDFRRFELVRDEDESGVSGTGIVAVGVVFPNSYVEMQWMNDQNKTSTKVNGHTSYPGGIEDVRRIHSHGGKTRIKWID